MKGAIALLVLGALAAGCTASQPERPSAAGTATSSSVPPGCDMVPRSRVVGLLGKDIDANVSGDPEVALAMSRALAQKLGVQEARGEG